MRGLVRIEPARRDQAADNLGQAQALRDGLADAILRLPPDPAPAGQAGADSECRLVAQ
jgi:hypothetical protein